MNDEACVDSSMRLNVGGGRFPLDFRCLLYRGGSATNAISLDSKIAAGLLGSPIASRSTLVLAIHSELKSQHVEGIAGSTLITRWQCLREFVAYVDSTDRPLDHIVAKARFKEWVQHINMRAQRKEIKARTGYGSVTRTSALLAAALALPLSEVMHGVRARKPKANPTARAGEKQNLEATKGFAGDLLDIIDSLNLEKLYLTLPVQIKLRSTGLSHSHWSGMVPDEKIKAVTSPDLLRPVDVANTRAARKVQAEASTMQVRRPLLNLRMAAEFMLFIAATGMNREQATKLTLGDFRYQSFEGRIEVRKYKGRRRGKVEFSIYPEYRQFFERYLEFRRTAYPNDLSKRLFVTLSPSCEPGDRVLNTEPLVKFLREIRRPWLPPQVLRNTKGNVLERLAGSNEAARLLQNSESVFNQHYVGSGHQAAAAELTRYWRSVAPGEVIASAAGPGGCAAEDGFRMQGEPEPNEPVADCANPAGCLFCAFNRGIDSLDYAWNLVSYRALKRIEMDKYKIGLPVDGQGAASATVARIGAILLQFGNNGEVHREWISVAEERIAVGNFHPRWGKWIELAEI